MQEPGNVAVIDDDPCHGRRGPNYETAFLYPAAAARIPALKRLLEERHRQFDGDVVELERYARENPEGRFFHHEIYEVDSDLPQLLALSMSAYGYQGGAHGWAALSELLWDRTGNRRVELGELFTDSARAFEEIERLLCPAFNDTRRRLHRQRGQTMPDRCPEPPYSARLIAGAGGPIDTLLLTFQEFDGYAGGPYTAEIPVTAQLHALVRPGFHGAFQTSARSPLVCNPNASAAACRF